MRLHVRLSALQISSQGTSPQASRKRASWRSLSAESAGGVPSRSRRHITCAKDSDQADPQTGNKVEFRRAAGERSDDARTPDVTRQGDGVQGWGRKSQLVAGLAFRPVPGSLDGSVRRTDLTRTAISKSWTGPGLAVRVGRACVRRDTSGSLSDSALEACPRARVDVVFTSEPGHVGCRGQGGSLRAPEGRCGWWLCCEVLQGCLCVCVDAFSRP